MIKKQKYYRLDSIDKVKAQYKILLGERSNGKSYAVKERAILNYLEKGEMFVLLRRFEVEIKMSSIESYFADSALVAFITSITHNKYNCIVPYQSGIYLAKRDYDTNKTVRGEKIGRYLYLGGYVHYKSQAFSENYTTIIYEEFVTNGLYIGNEPNVLQQMISTIFRKRDGIVYLIGNTISRVCPYFHEWALFNIPKQKQGTIETYKHINEDGEEIIIAVEFCDSSGGANKMFFGSVGKSISTGAWETKSMPKLEKDIAEYTMLYELKISNYGFNFIMQLLNDPLDGSCVLYVYPCTTNRHVKRVITEEFAINRLQSPRLYDNIKAEKMIKDLMHQNKICFSDNLTGGDFEQVMKNMGGIT